MAEYDRSLSESATGQDSLKANTGKFSESATADDNLTVLLDGGGESATASDTLVGVFSPTEKGVLLGTSTFGLSLFLVLTTRHHLLVDEDISTSQSIENTVWDGPFITQNFFHEIEPTRLFISQNISNMLTEIKFVIKNFYGTAYRVNNTLYGISFKSRNLRFNISENTTLWLGQKLYNNIIDALSTTHIVIEYKVLLDGLDVTDKVSSCSITYSSGSYVGELDIAWADTTLSAKLDCSNLNSNFMVERLEVLTRVATDDTPVWVSQGKFFLEKRSTSANYQSIGLSTWGRNRPAVLSMPYSKPLTRVWSENTTAKTIAEELCAEAPLPVTLLWEIMDFPVLGSNVDVEGTEPIEVISSLAAAVGGILTCTRDGYLKVIYTFLDDPNLVENPQPPDTPQILGVTGGDQQAVVYFD